jgi:hypothetical protein
MPNHFHFLVQLTRQTLSRGMHWLNGSYSIAFNNRHGRVGHVLQGRFKSPLVDKESYLLQLIRYIVLNPVEANIVQRPEDYRWSSYRASLALAPAPYWLAVDDVLLPFGPDRDLARAAFRDFVNAAIGVDSTFWRDLFERSYIGSDDWLEKTRERVALVPASTEHSFEQRVVIGPSITDVITAVAECYGLDPARIRCATDRTPRLLVAWIARKACAGTGIEIGAQLRLSAGRVTQLVQRCDTELRHDASLREAVSTVSRKLKIKDLTPRTSS